MVVVGRGHRHTLSLCEECEDTARWTQQAQSTCTRTTTSSSVCATTLNHHRYLEVRHAERVGKVVDGRLGELEQRPPDHHAADLPL